MKIIYHAKFEHHAKLILKLKTKQNKTKQKKQQQQQQTTTTTTKTNKQNKTKKTYCASNLSMNGMCGLSFESVKI